MVATDAYGLVGHWPFRKVRTPSFADLVRVHRDNAIGGGLVSSLDSIFYNDPLEGDQELHAMLKGSNYGHVITVNPLLPGFARDIQECIDRWQVTGVRIYPAYHGYGLEHPALGDLVALLRQTKRTLFLSLRMEDERLHHLFVPSPLSVSSIGDFLTTYGQNKIVLSNIRYGELMHIKKTLLANENCFFDTVGLKDHLFVLEKLLAGFPVERVIYGSAHPLCCLKSSLFLVKRAQISQEDQEQILSGNIARALSW